MASCRLREARLAATRCGGRRPGRGPCV